MKAETSEIFRRGVESNPLNPPLAKWDADFAARFIVLAAKFDPKILCRI
jgi:hypothetical protein